MKKLFTKAFLGVLAAGISTVAFAQEAAEAAVSEAPEAVGAAVSAPLLQAAKAKDNRAAAIRDFFILRTFFKSI